MIKFFLDYNLKVCKKISDREPNIEGKFAWILFDKQKDSARNELSDLGLIAKLSPYSVCPKNFLPNLKSSKCFWLHCSRVAPLFAPMHGVCKSKT